MSNTNKDNLVNLIYDYCAKHGLPEDKINHLFSDELDYWLDSKVEFKRRTTQQNAALHLYFTQLADALNAAGFDMAHFPYKKSASIPWTPETVKEYLWRSLQVAYLGKKSTRDLSKWEVDKVYDILNRYLGEKTGVFVEFPSEEALLHYK
jgi:hypothetical protein